MRRAFGILAPVTAVALAAALIVLGVHGLWMGSTRTLFSLQEQRQLTALGRCALDEACFLLQCDLDRSDGTAENFVRLPAAPRPLALAPVVTRANAEDLALAPGLVYSVSDVTVTRARPPLPGPRGGPREPGLIDFQVTVSVLRASPRHAATLLIGERRTVRLADELGPFAFAGKHLELSSSAVGRWLEPK